MKKYKVKAIETQGRTDGYEQWVSEYKVKYTKDGVNWHWADDERLFEGNSDQETKVLNKIDQPFKALAVRICPTQWNSHISMKAEVYVKPKKDKKGKGGHHHAQSSSSSGDEMTPNPDEAQADD